MKQPSFQEALSSLLEPLSGTQNLPLRALDDVLPHIDRSNPWCLELMGVSPSNLNGKYRIVDLYCQAPSCNCHKVSLVIIDKHQNIYATISYGWKSKAFYRSWGLDKDDAQSLSHGFLDPWGQQGKHASLFLKAFLFNLKRDHNFISRLKQRYSLFKKALASNPSLIRFYPDKEFPENVVPLNSYKKRF